jgi:putative ABC transport system permease protein
MVVGVTPKMVPEGYRPVQVWMPLEIHPPYIERGTNYLFTIGQLRPNVLPATGLAELRSIQAQSNKQFPNNKHDIQIELLSEATFGDLRAILNHLFAAVAFILVIACVNLANMLLARASEREPEFAMRRALGASGSSVVR